MIDYIVPTAKIRSLFIFALFFQDLLLCCLMFHSALTAIAASTLLLLTSSYPLVAQYLPLSDHEREVARHYPVYSEDNYDPANVTRIPWGNPPRRPSGGSRNWIFEEVNLWPGSVVYYSIDESFDNR